MLIRLFCIALSVLLFTPLAGIAQAEEPAEWTSKNLESLISLYRHLHANPEVSFHEKETAARLAEEWKKAGFEVTTGVGGHGLVAILKNGKGPTLMLRTDLDALPLEEKTGLPYASKVKIKDAAGQETFVMHACAHDLHMTNLTGVARYLSANKDRWQGTLMLIGQPAEERGAGARAMLEDGLFKRWPKPDFAVALHVDSYLPVGKIAYRSGYTFANVNSVDITMRGRGGHGSAPHTTIDPIVMAAQLVLELQTIVSREVKPGVPAVVTVGAINGGFKHNIIGDTCHLQLTVRSYTEEVKQQLLSAIERKAKGVAAAAGAPEPIIKLSEPTPALSNDEELTRRIVPSLKSAVGAENVSIHEPSMGGEDFSQYGLAGVPIVMYRLGTVPEERLAGYKAKKLPPPSLHSSQYYPDAEQALAAGIPSMCNIVLELLKK